MKTEMEMEVVKLPGRIKKRLDRIDIIETRRIRVRMWNRMIVGG